MDRWKIRELKKIRPKNSILIEGLPGIGNVGKIAVDFMIDKLKGKKILEITSHSFPHSVFVNDQNLVELPKVELYSVKVGTKDILILTGDVQPVDETSCYEFCELILEKAVKLNIKEIITLGGIGLNDIPDDPGVFCTGTDKEYIEKFAKGVKLNKDIYGVVGPIVGVTGVLLGLSEAYKIKSIALLAETIGHPMFMGIRSARSIIRILNKKLKLKLDVNKLDEEIKKLEEDIMKKTQELADVSKNTAMQNMERKFTKSQRYIG